MNEQDFLHKLQERAHEQEKIMRYMPFPTIFASLSKWLADHPWRYLIPLAFVVSLVLRSIFGSSYTDFILWLFRTI